MPSKGKKIEVDGRSMVGLKALVFEQEQKIKQGREQGGDSIRSLRGKRAAEVAQEQGDLRARKDIFARSNAGVSQRQKGDEEQHAKDPEALTMKQKEQKVAKSLKAKALLYNKMARGEIQGHEAPGVLVNFKGKTSEELKWLDRAEAFEKDEKQSVTAGGYSFPGDEVEVEDEFGRTRNVPRGSEAHTDYIRLVRERKERQPDRYSANLHSHTRHDPSAPTATGQYAWSKGVSDVPTSQHKNDSIHEDTNITGKKRLAALIHAHVEEDGLHMEEGHEGRTSFRLRDRWDTRLEQGQKDYIDELRQEGAAARSKDEKQKKAKTDRMEMLEKKLKGRTS